MQLLARAIVSTLHEEGTDALEWGYFLLVSCVVRPGASLGISACTAAYEDARREHEAAGGTKPRLIQLSPSYHAFQQFGVPESVCREVASQDKGPAGRARRLAEVPAGRGGGENALVVAAQKRKALTSRCVFDAVGNCWFILGDDGWGAPLVPNAFKTLLAQQGFGGKQANVIIEGARSFRRQELHPETQGDLLEIAGENVRNTFVGTHLEPTLGTFRDIDKLLLNVCNGDVGYREYLLDWVSFQLQGLYPRLSPRQRVKSKSARAVQTQIGIVLVGVQGSGKDTLAKIIATLIGEENCVVLDQATLDSNFRGQLKDKVFVFANEVMSSTNRSDETGNFMKSLIAGDKLVIEEKYKTAVTVRSVANVLIASNDSNPVIIEEGDRRYSVIRSTRRLDAAVSKRLYADLEGPRTQVSAFFNFLLNRKCFFAPGQLLETPERVTIQQQTLKSEKKFVAEIKADGWLSVSASWAGSRPAFTDNKVLTDENNIPASVLKEVYLHWCHQNSVKPRGSTRLGQAMKEMLGLVATKVGNDKVYPGEGLCPRPLLSIAKAPGGSITAPSAKASKGAA